MSESYAIGMSVDITEKQHYVWRRYLSSWQDDPGDYRVWTGLLNLKQVKRLGLKDVAQSRYFYRLEELTDVELAFLKQFAGQLSIWVKDLADVIIGGYEFYSSIKQAVAAGKLSMTQERHHELKRMEANVFESIHGQIESMGDALLKCKDSNDIRMRANEQEYDFLFYLLVQYMRTKIRKDSFYNALSARPDLQQIARKCWPFFNIVTAMQWVEAMLIKKDYRYVFVHNNSSIPFITGDQPAINTRWKETDAKSNIIGLEIYYPMSPTNALVIEFNSGKKYSDLDVDEEFVKERNRMIMEEAGLHVFANEEGVLKEMIYYAP